MGRYVSRVAGPIPAPVRCYLNIKTMHAGTKERKQKSKHAKMGLDSIVSIVFGIRKRKKKKTDLSGGWVLAILIRFVVEISIKQNASFLIFIDQKYSHRKRNEHCKRRNCKREINSFIDLSDECDYFRKHSAGERMVFERIFRLLVPGYVPRI